MDIILQRERKINGFAEKFTNKPDNISMKRARRYTTIQLDIIHTGDCLKILKTLPDDSVHCCVTSPPYYALRDYGMEAQIGRETTPKEYISRLTEVFTEVRRVLRPDGTLWLNISDTYAGKGNQGEFIDPKNPYGRNGQAVALNNKVEGCKAKDMIGIPWMPAFALRDTGWYLRNDIIWMKDNPMPESVKDRCARCYEHIFLFSKSKKYFFDYKAISEPIAPATAERLKYAVKIDLIDVNPADKVERPKKDRYVGSFYDADEVNALFEAAKGSKLELPILFGAFYGLRRSEAIGLKWDAIDFDQNTITIRHTVTSCDLDGKRVLVASDTTKTKSSMRTLPLVPFMRERLLALKESSRKTAACADAATSRNIL